MLRLGYFDGSVSPRFEKSVSMPQLTESGKSIVNDLSNRHGFSRDAIEHMLVSVINGNGQMAQFSHPEFAGYGQWMRGGMIMLGDMFNNSLKGRVDSLCCEISNLLTSQPDFFMAASSQSQSQGSGSSNTLNGSSNWFVPDANHNWWPQDLGSPAALGSQNDTRYAYFPNSRRLAVKTGTSVWVYDTLNHQIGGFSQQQGSGSGIIFTSQMGTVVLSSLPVVMKDGQPVTTPTIPSFPMPPANNTLPPLADAPVENAPLTTVLPANAPLAPTPTDSDIFATIEKLATLKSKGFISDAEFESKKSELLSRL